MFLSLIDLEDSTPVWKRLLVTYGIFCSCLFNKEVLMLKQSRQRHFSIPVAGCNINPVVSSYKDEAKQS